MKKKKGIRQIIDETREGLNRSQKRALLDTLEDLHKGHLTERLLYGEVGSGKTRVAIAAATYVCKILKAQVAIMCPTTELAKQHVDSLREAWGDDDDDEIAVVFSGQGKKEKHLNRTERIAGRRAGVAVGTQALANCQFNNLRLVIVDEQQKFGTQIRADLVKRIKRKRDGAVLYMTATPIPRTIGQLVMQWESNVQISEIDPRTEERADVKTTVLYDADAPRTKNAILRRIKKHAARGVAILVAPCIEPNDKLVDCAQLCDMLKGERGIADNKVALLHGKMDRNEKAEAVEAIRSGRKKILVTTSIIEVGIHLPAASLVVLFQCDRFGLSQIHQIRGRVGRTRNGRLQGAECVLVAPQKSQMSDKTRRRTQTAKTPGVSGLSLAVDDSKIRGPGQLHGTAQHGYDLEKDDLPLPIKI